MPFNYHAFLIASTFGNTVFNGIFINRKQYVAFDLADSDTGIELRRGDVHASLTDWSN